MNMAIKNTQIICILFNILDVTTILSALLDAVVFCHLFGFGSFVCQAMGCFDSALGHMNTAVHDLQDSAHKCLHKGGGDQAAAFACVAQVRHNFSVLSVPSLYDKSVNRIALCTYFLQ